MQFSEMKALVLLLISEANYNTFTETFVEKAINLGCIDFLDKSEVQDTHWTISTVANKFWYLCPTNSFEVIRVAWEDASEDDVKKPLVKKTFKEMDEEYPDDATNYDEDLDWEQITGDPAVWIPKEYDVIGIYPACDVNSDKIYIYGPKKHVDMTADANEPGIPVQYQLVPCLFAAHLLLLSDNDPKTTKFEKKYEVELARANRRIIKHKKQIPDKWRRYTY